jgi:trimeric autotransporter adhesin
MIRNIQTREWANRLFSLACYSLIVSCARPAAAQQYTISTIAGGGAFLSSLPSVSRAVNLPMGPASGIAVDSAGNVFFAAGDSIFKLDPTGIATRIAGTGRRGYAGDGGPAVSAQLSQPLGLTVDGSGNLFIVDDTRIRRIAPSGVIATIAGNVARGYLGDGKPAVTALFGYPDAIAADRAGNLFIADSGSNSVRRVSASGIVTTVAGNGAVGFGGDGGPAAQAQLSEPLGLAVDDAGNLYIADAGNRRIRKVSSSGVITTVAGNGATGSSSDGGAATEAAFAGPQAVALDSAGNLYVADCDCTWDGDGSARIRKISPAGLITTVAGNGTSGFSGDGGPATGAQLSGASAIALDAAGNLFIADDYNYRVREVSPNGVIMTVAGSGEPASVNVPGNGDGGSATAASLNQPWGITLDSVGNLFIAGIGIQKVSADGIIHNFANAGGVAIAADSAGDLFTAGLAISKISPAGVATQVAGVGAFGTSGVGGNGIAVDSAGNLYVGSGSVVSKVSPAGQATTIAGGGTDPNGDGGPATNARLNNVTGVAFDRAGNLYLSENYAHRVRKISSDGTITTVAGIGTPGFSGDGGPATRAQLSGPDGLAFDAAGNLYIAELYNNRIRMVTAGGIITSIAGAGPAGYLGDGGPAANAQLFSPRSLAVDQQGNVYVADSGNAVIRLLRPAHTALLIGSVVNSATGQAGPFSPGEIITIYGAGLGPASPVSNQANNGQFGSELAGVTVSFNGVPAPLLYASASQIVTVAPFAVPSGSALLTVTYNGATSPASSLAVTPSAPGLFTANQTGAGQLAAINAVDETINSAANPAKVGAYVSLYATGGGQTSPPGVDGKLTGTAPALPVSATVGGVPAPVQYAAGAPGQVAGLMQINVQIPNALQPGGYVPIVLKIGDAATAPDSVWIAVAGN